MSICLIHRKTRTKSIINVLYTSGSTRSSPLIGDPFHHWVTYMDVLYGSKWLEWIWGPIKHPWTHVCVNDLKIRISIIRVNIGLLLCCKSRSCFSSASDKRGVRAAPPMARGRGHLLLEGDAGKAPDHPTFCNIPHGAATVLANFWHNQQIFMVDAPSTSVNDRTVPGLCQGHCGLQDTLVPGNASSGPACHPTWKQHCHIEICPWWRIQKHLFIRFILRTHVLWFCEHKIPLPSERRTWSMCWFNVGPPSTTVAQHWNSTVSTSSTTCNWIREHEVLFRGHEIGNYCSVVMAWKKYGGATHRPYVLMSLYR